MLGLLAWKNCPERARRRVCEPAIETAGAARMRASTRRACGGMRRQAGDGGTGKEAARNGRVAAKSGKAPTRSRFARAGHPIILIAALLIAHHAAPYIVWRDDSKRFYRDGES
ncbi:hypothetical protein [Burkholderia pseudomultivorans]|uniref:hypothetical protein n=1 Tax=Burkholderia pseudomultivorans TaxID=1207504 RepID=UPI0012DA6FF5|nr:hypothetical protein [Burkholderia pseudomultivorans]